LNRATDDPVPESPDSRPRLGDLLLGAGLISQEQLEECLTLARKAGLPLGHVLVEQGLVPAHSLAMALADQHGGPLKTEFGFATGRGSTPRPAALPDQARSTPPPLRLASAPLRDEQAEAAEAAARLDAEARAAELLARVEELESDLTAERAGRAAEAAALAAVHGELAAALADAGDLRAVIELQEEVLATASARELASTRCYSQDTHFLFAPRADGYELLERSGPSPAPGEVVELSGGRTCRVLRVGPPPFPGAPEACAYLELV
jgi:hypothetical protein